MDTNKKYSFRLETFHSLQSVGLLRKEINISAAVILAHLSYLLDFGPFEHLFQNFKMYFETHAKPYEGGTKL